MASCCKPGADTTVCIKEAPASATSKPRLLVITDIGGDPDDTQSMVRLMVYANEFQIEGLVASASGTIGELKEHIVQPDRIRAIVNAYGKVQRKLAESDPAYPTAEALLSVVKAGNPERGRDAIGEGHDTEASRHILERIDAGTEDAPLNISIWGGQTDLAQALWRVKRERGEEGIAAFVRKFRVYDIDDQDHLVPWMRQEFPGMRYILAKSREGHSKEEAVYRGMFLTGDLSTTSREWIERHIVRNSPLGALYPLQTWTWSNPNGCMKEGDTPSWLFFLPQGGNAPDDPTKPGWGGQFVREEDGLYRDIPAGQGLDPAETVSRWRPDFQRDFARRMALTRYDQANQFDKAASDTLPTYDLQLCANLRQIGTIRPRDASQAPGQNWTLGCETMDRDYTDWDQYRDYVAPLGIRTIRLQGGWAKCEKVQGVYDFAWLDHVIDDARAQGLNILLETGYGNPLYKGDHELKAGIPTSEEALAAWDRWVEAMATHFKGRVTDWAMWNEPDLNKDNTMEIIAQFNVRTAEILRRIIPDARIAGLSLASADCEKLHACLKEIRRLGKLDLFQWYIYHGYCYNPDANYQTVRDLQTTLSQYTDKASMRQGENGCPSTRTDFYALRDYDWTEVSQAKWDVRRMLSDLELGVESAIFTICDFQQKGRDVNRKGLLHANADKSVHHAKLAYYAVQNLVAVFDETLERDRTGSAGLLASGPSSTGQAACFVYRRKGTGAPLIAFWDRSEKPSDSLATSKVDLVTKGLSFAHPVWCDLVSGRVYEIPAAMIHADGKYLRFEGLPYYDSPAILADLAALPVETH